MGSKVTSALIAEKAQVSPATVSRVLNHPELVKRSTVEQVEEAMRELGFAGAAKIAKPVGTQPIIVLNIPGIENIFYQELIIRESA